jgi:hypothetical protein
VLYLKIVVLMRGVHRRSELRRRLLCWICFKSWRRNQCYRTGHGVTSGFTSDPSGVTPVTVVTFVNTGAFFTLHFCGDQHSLFPLNDAARRLYQGHSVFFISEGDHHQ